MNPDKEAQREKNILKREIRRARREIIERQLKLGEMIVEITEAAEIIRNQGMRLARMEKELD